MTDPGGIRLATRYLQVIKAGWIHPRHLPAGVVGL